MNNRPMVETKFAVSVHLMTALAYNPGKTMSSEELSKSLCTNPSFVRKLIVLLASAGLIKSHRGKSGGVELSKSPQNIFLSQIYDAVTDKRLIMLPEKPPYKLCPVSCSMGKIMEGVSEKMQDSIKESLYKIKLSEILKQVKT